MQVAPDAELLRKACLSRALQYSRTAIEELCDRISSEFDPAIGRVKDLAAGAVLVASIAAALIGVLTLGPPLMTQLA